MTTRLSCVRLECLEARRLLSGNVHAWVEDGDLFLVGDNRANSITIRAGAAGALVIEGTETTINGEATPANISGITGDIRLNLRHGRNAVTLEGVTLPHALDIRSGNQADTIILRQVQVGGDLRLDTGAGNDSVYVLQSSVGGGSVIQTQAGDDLIAADGSTFNGDFLLKAGAGHDSFAEVNSAFNGTKRIDGGPGRDQLQAQPISLSFDFNRGDRGWRADYADYSPGQEDTIDFRSGIRPLPDSLGTRGRGFLLQGKNVSDDLFMYLTKMLTRHQGIRPNQSYQVSFTIRFASNAPTGAVGVGGAPGESVWLKAGASATRPRARQLGDLIRTNIDHADQSGSGTAVSVVSNIANGIEDVNPPYVSLVREHVHPFVISADSHGRLHLIVGTESGFESTTAIYIQRIDVRLIPVAQPSQEKRPDYSSKPPDENPV